MASYIVEDDQSSKVLHKLFCKIINLLWLKVLAFFQWRYLRLFIFQMWFKLAFRDWSFLLSSHCFPGLQTSSGSSVFHTQSYCWDIQICLFSSEHKKLEMQFTSYLPSFPSCSELDPLQSWENERWETQRQINDTL